MTRSGYVDGCDLDTWDLIRWRGAVRSAIRGKRGQAFLREMRDALDAMEPKALEASVFVSESGCCAMGAVAISRGLDTAGLDETDKDQVGALLNIAPALAAEIASENDGDYSYRNLTPEERWTYMRRWVERQIKEEVAQCATDQT